LGSETNKNRHALRVHRPLNIRRRKFDSGLPSSFAQPSKNTLTFGSTSMVILDRITRSFAMSANSSKKKFAQG
jgi:hypothetical protein